MRVSETNVVALTKAPRKTKQPRAVATDLLRGDHVELADRIADQLRGGGRVIGAEGQIFRYCDSGLWAPVDRHELSRRVQGFAGATVDCDSKPLRLKASDVQGTLRLAYDQLAETSFFSEAPRGLAFKNGFVTVTKNGVSIVEHSPEHRARAGYDFDFTANGLAFAWLKFLHSLFRGDNDQSEKIDCIQEFGGACLLGFAPTYQRCLVSIGKGGEGKSSLAKILVATMPRGTTCAIAPQEWGNEYRRALLAGKRLNVVAELPVADIIASEAFKAIVTGDPIVGRHIRAAPFTFEPISGHFFGANKLPGTNDQSEGFWRRIIVICFNRSFKDDPDKNPHIADEIIAAELPAIVGWFVQGAVRLLGHRDYTLPASHGDAIATWRKNADQVALFVEEKTRRLTLHEEAGEPAAVFYRTYRAWAAENGHRPVASNKFGERMKQLGLGAVHTKYGNRYPLAVRTEKEVDQ